MMQGVPMAIPPGCQPGACGDQQLMIQGVPMVMPPGFQPGACGDQQFMMQGVPMATPQGCAPRAGGEPPGVLVPHGHVGPCTSLSFVQPGGAPGGAPGALVGGPSSVVGGPFPGLSGAFSQSNGAMTITGPDMNGSGVPDILEQGQFNPMQGVTTVSQPMNAIVPPTLSYHGGMEPAQPLTSVLVTGPDYNGDGIPDVLQQPNLQLQGMTPSVPPPGQPITSMMAPDQGLAPPGMMFTSVVVPDAGPAPMMMFPGQPMPPQTVPSYVPAMSVPTSVMMPSMAPSYTPLVTAQPMTTPIMMY